jgi:hypothetical protein
MPVRKEREEGLSTEEKKEMKYLYTTGADDLTLKVTKQWLSDPFQSGNAIQLSYGRVSGRLYSRILTGWETKRSPDQPDEPLTLDAMEVPQGFVGDDVPSGSSSKG